MKLLLDECVTRKIKREFAGHEVHTIEEAGMKGLKNGQLLRAASGRYDVLITVDRNMSRQQNLKTFQISVLVLVGRKNTYDVLKPLVRQALETLKNIRSGEIAVIKTP